MIATELRLPELGLIAGTRGMLGAGIGLLVADKLQRPSHGQRDVARDDGLQPPATVSALSTF